MLSKSFKYCLDSLENETYCAHLVDFFKYDAIEREWERECVSRLFLEVNQASLDRNGSFIFRMPVTLA